MVVDLSEEVRPGRIDDIDVAKWGNAVLEVSPKSVAGAAIV